MFMRSPFVNIHTHHQSPADAQIQIVSVMASHQPPAKGYFSVGLHPWQLKDSDWNRKLQTLETFGNHPELLAIGEAGIDKAINVDVELQKEVFKHQVLLSEAWQLPLIIHAVRSSNELIGMNQKLTPGMPWIIHGFNGRETIAQAYLRQGFYLSFGKALIRPNRALEASLQACPDDRLFLETDDANVGIDQVYEAAAQIRGITYEDLREIIYRNFVRLFGARLQHGTMGHTH